MRSPVARSHVPTRFLAVGLAVFVVVVGAVIGGIVLATSGGGKRAPATATTTAAARTHPAHLSHRELALLYTGAVLYKTRISVLAQWPTPPYQHYISGKQDCYEWWDKPIALYNLCFRNGVLTTKAIE
jgi:hypothetical protein